MANMTAKELSAIEDQLGMESNMIKKYRLYAQSCQDQEIRTKCEEIASRHQSHFNTLMEHLS